MNILKNRLSFINKYRSKFYNYFETSKSYLFSFNRLSIPSLSSVFIFFIIGFFFLLLGTNVLYLLGLDCFLNSCSSKSFYSLSYFFYQISNIDRENIISIHIGFGALLVGLLFFISQSILDRKEPERGRTLMTYTGVYGLAMMQVIGLFILFLPWFDKLNIIYVFFVGSIAIWTCVSIYRLIYSLVNEHDWNDLVRKMLMSVTQQSFKTMIESDLQKRKKTNEMISHFQQTNYNNLIGFDKLSTYKSDDFYSIYSAKKGIITDINYNKIESLFSRIAKLKPKPTKPITEDDEILSNDTATKESDPYITFVVSYGDSVDDASLIGKINISDINNDIRKYNVKDIDRLFRSIFTVSDSEKHLYKLKKARYELEKLRNRMINVIKNNDLVNLSLQIKLYQSLVEQYFLILSKEKITITSKQAEQERSSFFGGFKFMSWLEEEIRFIFKEAIKSGSLEIVSEVTYLPIHFCNKAIENNDHFLFQSFIRYPLRMYNLAYEMDSGQEIKVFLLDRSHRYLMEMYRFSFLSQFKENDGRWDGGIDYYIYILKAFQSLLKSSYENNDPHGFSIFLKKVLSTLNDGYDRSRIPSEDLKRFVFRRSQMLFGITSWILNSGKEYSEVFFKLMYQACYQKMSFADLSKTFVSVHDYDTESFRGWGSWDLEGKEEGEVHMISILDYLKNTYIYLALSISLSDADKDIEWFSEMERLYALYSVFKNDGFDSVLKRIIDNGLQNVKVSTDKKSLSTLREIIGKIKNKYDELYLSFVRETRASPEKLNNFKKAFLAEYQKEKGIKDMYKYLGKYNDKTDIPYEKCLSELKKLGVNKPTLRLGFNQFSYKEPFLPSSNKFSPTIYMGLDDAFGYGGIFNDAHLDQFTIEMNKLAKKDMSDFDSIIEDFIASKKKPIIVFLNTDSWILSHAKYKGIVSGEIDTKFGSMPRGTYTLKGTTVETFSFYNNKIQPTILILDQNSLGTLNIYNPINSEDEKKYKEGEFYYNVYDLYSGMEEFKTLMKNPPTWLKGKSQEEISNYLLENIIMKIFIKFHFEGLGGIYGYRIDNPTIK